MKTIAGRNPLTDAHRLGLYLALTGVSFSLSMLFLVPLDGETTVSVIVSAVIRTFILVYLLRTGSWNMFLSLPLTRAGLVAYFILQLATGIVDWVPPISWLWLAGHVFYYVSVGLLLFGPDRGGKRRLAFVLFAFYTIVTIGMVVVARDVVANLDTDIATEYGLLDLEQELPGIAEILPDQWTMRDPATYADENPDVSLWVVDPIRDSHIMVILENVSDIEFEHQDYVDVVKGNFQNLGASDIVDVSSDANSGYQRTRFTVAVEIEGVEFNYLVSAMTNQDEAIQIVGFAVGEVFFASLDDIKGFIESFSVSQIPHIYGSVMSGTRD